MEKVYLSKEMKKAIAKAMSKQTRKKWKNGEEEFTVEIKRTGRSLKRWGKEAIIRIKGNLIISNNLIENTWKENDINQAAVALDYFVYGDDYNYIVTIM